MEVLPKGALGPFSIVASIIRIGFGVWGGHFTINATMIIRSP